MFHLLNVFRSLNQPKKDYKKMYRIFITVRNMLLLKTRMSLEAQIDGRKSRVSRHQTRVVPDNIFLMNARPDARLADTQGEGENGMPSCFDNRSTQTVHNPVTFLLSLGRDLHSGLNFLNMRIKMPIGDKKINSIYVLTGTRFREQCFVCTFSLVCFSFNLGYWIF